MHGHPYKPSPRLAPTSHSAMRLLWVLIACAVAYVVAIDDRSDTAQPSACVTEVADASR